MMRFATAALGYGVAGPIGRLAARSAKVPDPPVRAGSYAEGPWFDNNLAVLELAPGSLRMWWVSGNVEGGTTTTAPDEGRRYALGD